MTSPHKAEAERLLAEAAAVTPIGTTQANFAAAQIHATLAVADSLEDISDRLAALARP